ncbi:unnamed protein product, partial [Linum tenue]
MDESRSRSIMDESSSSELETRSEMVMAPRTAAPLSIDGNGGDGDDGKDLGIRDSVAVAMVMAPCSRFVPISAMFLPLLPFFAQPLAYAETRRPWRKPQRR